MAYIEKRGNSYRIMVSIGRDVDGKKITKSTTYTPRNTAPSKIKKEVEQAAADFEKKVLTGKYLAGEEITFAQFVPEWKEYIKNKVTTNVFEGYVRIVDQKFLPEFGTMRLAKINAMHLQKLYNEMREQGRAPATIKRVNSVASSIFGYAYRMNILQENICNRIELPKLEKDTDLHYFTLEQAKTFLRVCENPHLSVHKAHERHLEDDTVWNISEYSESRSTPFQYVVFFTLALYGGFRRGELIGLTWEDIDFEKMTVSINKSVSRTSSGQIVKTTKTASGNRVIRLPRQCFDVLRKWKAEEMELSMKLGTKWEGYRGADFDKNPIFINLQTGRRMDLDTPGHKFTEILENYNKNVPEDEQLP